MSDKMYYFQCKACSGWGYIYFTPSNRVLVIKLVNCVHEANENWSIGRIDKTLEQIFDENENEIVEVLYI